MMNFLPLNIKYDKEKNSKLININISGEKIKY